MSSEDEGPNATDEWRHTYKRSKIAHLYPTQRTITEWGGDLTVVIGGPGGSKTTTKNLLADRLTAEGGYAPDECGILSFNRSVATETQEALERELGIRGYDIGVTTAHAKAIEVLGKVGLGARRGGPQVQIADEADQELALQEALHRIDDPDVSTHNVSSTLKKINVLKQSGATPDELEEALGAADEYERAGRLVTQTGTVAASVLRPTEATPAELSRIQGHLLTIADTLAESIPAEFESAESELAPLARDAWTYVDFLRQTASRCVSWLRTNEAEICGSHPELAALPGYLLGDEQASSHLQGDVSSWGVSYRPHHEASLFLEEVSEAAAGVETWRAYQDELDARGLLDFEDALTEAVRLLKEDPKIRSDVQLQRLLVDETQDLSPPMLEFARLLADDEVILFGDTGQTINEWAGANRTTVRRLLAEGAVEEVLAVDFRKAPPIEAVCDAFRSTIDGEDALEMDSHREMARGDSDSWVSGADLSWPESPIRWVDQTDDGQAEYEAVIRAIEANRVPGWEVPEDAQVATLGRTGASVESAQQSLDRLGVPHEVRGGDDEDSVTRVCTLLRLVATVGGLGPQTEYVGQYDTTADPSKFTLELDESDAVSELPSILEWFFDIPPTVATSALDRDECNQWIALGRIAANGKDDWLDHPAYRPAFEHAYQTLLTLAQRAWMDRLPRLVDVVRERCPLDRQFDDPEVALDALDEAIDAIGGPQRDRPPRADLGAIRQLEARWSVETDSNQDARHVVSNIHQFKGSEADVVIFRGLVPSRWTVKDLIADPVQRGYAVRSLARVRHRLAFNECPATESFAQRKLHNERRVAYVGISRARDLLVLLGRGDSTGRGVPASAVDPDGCLPASVARYDLTQTFDVWSELHQAIDGTSGREWTRDELGLSEDDTM